jgi:hypothetical protein
MSYVLKRDRTLDFKGELDAYNRRSGFGICMYENNEKYVGHWKNGKRHGEGSYYYRDGSIYKGDWKDGKQNGRGVLKYINGQQYSGSWKKGKKSGIGTYKFIDGSTLTSRWEDDECLSDSGIPVDFVDATSSKKEIVQPEISKIIKKRVRKKREFFSKKTSKYVRKY